MDLGSIRYRNILVALDGSEAAEAVLPHVEALARAFNARVTLLVATESLESVVTETAPPLASDIPPVAVDPAPIVQSEHDNARGYLASVVARLTARGVTTTFQQPEGDPVDSILTTAQRLPADLIAMTTHSRSRLGRLVFGSVADDVLRNSPCPVLIVRVDEDPEGVRLAEAAQLVEPEPQPLVPAV
jgi:nucleotide-binding universal stress UspA family protein